MKKTIPAFLAGVLTTALVSTIALSALAASGRMTIEVDPINVQVNGEVFAPKDATGADVPVFAYNGTTYAPLRALAEAYGLEVGYDSEKNMATVTSGSQPAFFADKNEEPVSGEEDYSFDYSYEEFKGLWEDGRSESPSGGRIFWSLDDEKTLAWANGVSSQLLEEYATMLTKENPLDTHSDFALRHGKNAGQIVCTIDLQ